MNEINYEHLFKQEFSFLNSDEIEELVQHYNSIDDKSMETQNNHDTFYPESAAPLKKILSTVKARLGKSHPTFSELNILHGTK